MARKQIAKDTTGPQQYVAYYRVSTDRQGQSGLGLDAQRAKVVEFIKVRGGHIVASFEDVMSGRKRNRPGLVDALAHCKSSGAVLIVAKLDRLARDVGLVLNIQESKVGVVFIDLDMDKRRLSIRTYTKSELNMASRQLAELELENRTQPNKDVLLASVPSVRELKRAYPNYFADTDVFLRELRQILR